MTLGDAVATFLKWRNASVLFLSVWMHTSCSTAPELGTAEQVTVRSFGSGYAELAGAVINYTYEDFSGFRTTFVDGKIRYRGMQGYSKGIVNEAAPQVSKVSDGVFFVSWPTRGDGGDNVVYNFSSMRVFAHLKRDGVMDYVLLHGEIHCKDTRDCISPAGPVTPRSERPAIIQHNIAEQKLPSRESIQRPLTNANIAARDALWGRKIRFKTPQGSSGVWVDGDTTNVKNAVGDQKIYKTYVTKVSDGVFLISWLGNAEFGGAHIVFNQKTMKVFDHITGNGLRAEAVYSVDCFDVVQNC